MKTLAVGALLLCVGLAAAEKGTPARHAWIAFGRVANAEGKGMPGVVVRANAGRGTLLPTGVTTTDADGNYRLAFGAGWVSKDKFGRLDLPETRPQVAIIRPCKAGYYERDLHRQGRLCIAGKVPTGRLREFFPPDKAVLPHQPVRIDFVLLPAATLVVRVVDHKGKPLTGQRIYMDGEELCPGASVLGIFTPDEDGAFTTGDVPLKSYWFTPNDGKLHNLRSNELTFTNPALYEVELVLDRRWRKKTLTAKVVAKPRPAGGDRK